LLSTPVSLLLLGSPEIVAAEQRGGAVTNNMQERDIGVGSNACYDYGGCMQVPKHLPQQKAIP